MKKFSILLAACCILQTACGDNQSVQEDSGLPPDAQPTSNFNSSNFDNHYNTTFKVTKSTCGDGYISPTYEKVDFVSYANNNGMIVFDNKFYQDWVDIEINDGGDFEKTIPAEAFFFLTSYWGYGLKLSGSFENNRIEGTVQETIYFGETEKIAAYCYMDYEFSGYKRFKSGATKPKYLEGEYKTKISKKKSNDCPGQSLLDDYFVTLVREQKSNYDFTVDTHWLPELTIASDGAIDASYDDNGIHYLLKGNISPENLALDLTIKWDAYKCTEDYSISGEKRFEEADGKDATFDGIYAIWVEVESNTCSKETTARKYHLNVLKTAEGKAQIALANKLFEKATIDSKNNLSASYDDGYGYTSLHTLKGTVTSNKINASLVIDIVNGKFSCSYKYKITGEKLYKHN